MTDSVATPPVCLNCGATLAGRFCSACGQEALPLDPSLASLARDTVHELFDVDGRVFRSLRRLFFSPGFLTRERFEGRRAAWLSPLRLYLLCSVAYFAAVSLAGRPSNVTITVTPDTEAAAELQRRGYADEAELVAAIERAYSTWMPRVMFVLVPVCAWLVSLVRRRSRRGYPQHLYFALHVHAAWFGFAALITPIAMLLPAFDEELRRALSLVYWSVYVALALQTAYGIGRRRALLDMAVVTLVYGVLILGATAAIFAAAFFGRA